MTGYGGQHQATRKAWLPYAAGSACARCGRPILPGQPVDLDHADDRVTYLGWSTAGAIGRPAPGWVMSAAVHGEKGHE